MKPWNRREVLGATLALLAGGRFRTVSPSRHTRTNVEVLRWFLGDDVASLEERDDGDADVTVLSRGR